MKSHTRPDRFLRRRRDRQRMREIGRRLADAYLRDPPLLESDTSSEPAAGNGFTVAKAVGIGERFNTDLPDAR